jgi:hypothetical protein
MQIPFREPIFIGFIHYPNQTSENLLFTTSENGLKSSQFFAREHCARATIKNRSKKQM